jgi:hypothetical protein
MDIKIGFIDSPRELVVSSNDSQEAAVAKVSAALKSGDGVLELEDTKGSRYLVRNDRIAFVEFGSNAARAVGFAGA